MSERSGLPAQLLGALREETGCADLQYARAPERIPSGHETAVYALELAGGPDGLGGPSIARCFDAPGGSREASIEAAVHEGLHAQGFPVPRVLAARDAEPAFVLMERLPGRSLADGLELETGLGARLAALAALARSSMSLPDRLGETTGRLLALDAEPVLRALAARGLPPDALTFERHLARFGERIGRAALHGHAAGLRWLEANRPPEPERPAICHGDLAPNLLLERGRVTGVIDWSSEFVTAGDPAFEIANSRVMLQVPLPLPRPLRPVSAAYQRSLVRRFDRALGPARAPGPERLGYYEAWRSFRALLNAGELWRACAAGAPLPERPDPWCVPEVTFRVADGFRARTGVAVALPDPPGPWGGPAG